MDEIYDLAGAAAYLTRSPRWVREQAKLKHISHERPGRKFRFTRADLDEYLRKFRHQANPGVYA